MIKGLLSKPRSDRKDDYYNYNLRNARIKAGYTLKQLAVRAGISPWLIIHYERMRVYPSSQMAESIAEALGKKTEEIFPEKLRYLIKEIQQERAKHPSPILRLLKKAETKPLTYLGERALHDYYSLKNPESLEEISQGQLSLEDTTLKTTSGHELKQKIEEVLDTLDERERIVIRLGYGIGTGTSYTLKEIGRIFGVIPERVRQIESKAIRILQHSVKSLKLKDFITPQAWRPINQSIQPAPLWIYPSERKKAKNPERYALPKAG